MRSETDILGNETLWCINNFTMNSGLLQTKDAYVDNLKVGTSAVDGTVNLLGGSVNINPDKSGNGFGTLEILGTTQANVPILNVGAATLNFKVDMSPNSNLCDKLFVGGSGTPGDSGGTGKVNFGYNNTTTTVAIIPQGTTTTGHKWQVIFFGSRNNTPTITPATSYTPRWLNNALEIDN